LKVMAPKLYSLKASPAVRAVVITAKAIGLALDEHELDWEKGELRSPEYLKINPQHTVPTLDDNGKIICDSHAINAYLVGKYGKDDSLYPKDLYKRAMVDQKLAFDIGTLYPALLMVDYAYLRKEIKSVPPHMVEKLKEAYEILEKFLDGKQWIAGDHVTIADFSCVATITCLDYHVHVDPKVYPNAAAWLKRALALPCFASDHERLTEFRKFIDALKV